MNKKRREKIIWKKKTFSADEWINTKCFVVKLKVNTNKINCVKYLEMKSRMRTGRARETVI